MEELKGRTIVKRKTYTISMIELSDGNSLIHRTNDGFNAYELLGLAHNLTLDIQEQIAGRIKPDIIKRDVVETNP